MPTRQENIRMVMGKKHSQHEEDQFLNQRQGGGQAHPRQALTGGGSHHVRSAPTAHGKYPMEPDLRAGPSKSNPQAGGKSQSIAVAMNRKRLAPHGGGPEPGGRPVRTKRFVTTSNKSGSSGTTSTV